MLIDRTNERMMRLLVNATRQASLTGPALAEAHRSVGRALATSIAELVALEDVTIDHVAGTSAGVQVRSGTEPIVVALLRAGLFVAEGVWSSIPGSALVLHGGGSNIVSPPTSGRTIVVVDSVINTGRSIRKVLDVVATFQPSAVAVATLVAFRSGIERLVDDYPRVDFHVARISDRSYVGRGTTDTGSRLFETTSWQQIDG